MLVINVKENDSLEKALKKFKKKCVNAFLLMRQIQKKNGLIMESISNIAQF